MKRSPANVSKIDMKKKSYQERALFHAEKPFIKLTDKKYDIDSKNGIIVYDKKPLDPSKTYIGHMGAEQSIFQNRISYGAYTHFMRYLHASKLVRGQDKLVLDIGSGVSSIGRFLYQTLKKPQYVCVDLDLRLLRQAVNRGFGFCPVLFIQRDLYKPLPFKKNTFDYVFAYEVIEHLEEGDSKKLIKEIQRVTKNNGVASIATPNNFKKEDPKEKANKFRRYKKHKEITSGGVDYHLFEWSYKRLRKFLNDKTKFSITSEFGIGADTMREFDFRDEEFINKMVDFLPSEIARSLITLDIPEKAPQMVFDLIKDK